LKEHNGDTYNRRRHFKDSKLENPNRELKVEDTDDIIVWRGLRDSKLENPNRELKGKYVL